MIYCRAANKKEFVTGKSTQLEYVVRTECQRTIQLQPNFRRITVIVCGALYTYEIMYTITLHVPFTIRWTMKSFGTSAF